MAELSPVDRLAPWIPEPTLARPALEFVLAAERPLLLREVAEGIKVRPSSLTAVLQRLAEKGLIRAFKLPMQMPNNRYPGKTITRSVWLYERPKEG